MDKLPIYEITIDPETESDVEVNYVALVGKPAIERDFLAFNRNEPASRITFIADEERRIISGPAMVPDTLIYRRDPETQEEYNVFFSAKTIENIALKFFKKGYEKNLNLFHDPNLSLDGITIFESFISDTGRGILTMKGFEDLPNGTWFVSAKVENDEVWEKIKDGTVKGFSVEGLFTRELKQQPTQLDAFLSAIIPVNSHIQLESLKTNPSIMSKIKSLLADLKKEIFGAEPQKFETHKLVDGTEVSVTTLAVGGVVTIGDTPAPAGTHELEGGTKITVDENGVITAVEDAKPAEMSSHKLKDGSEIKVTSLEVGATATINDAPAPAGDYEFEDGTKITIGESGLITAITPVAPIDPPAPTQEEQMESAKTAMAKFATGTPEERIAGLEVVCRALMEYTFGWEIRRAEEEQKRAEAIAVYRTGLEKVEKDAAEKIKAANAELSKAQQTIQKMEGMMKSMFEVVEQLGSEPSAEPVGETNTSIVSETMQSKIKSREKLAAALKERFGKN